MSSPRLARIRVYPIKSLDPVDVNEARVLACGALEHDRQFALSDSAGRWINGKRTPRVHALRARVDLQARTVCFQTDSTAATFAIDLQRHELESWLTIFFGLPVHLVEQPDGGVPDDSAAPGPTLISTATLEAVASWFPGMDVEQARRRFRANLEIEGVEAFWEDRLYGSHGQTVGFRIGQVHWQGTNPCRRCFVPTRNPMGGPGTEEFIERFSARRRDTLPPWAPRDRFDHYYRLAVNTRLADRGTGLIRIGDPVSVAPE